MKIENSFWQGKRVLITGHTGFKGSWLTFWLLRMGASITGISLKPDTNPSLFELLNFSKDINCCICDINNYTELSKIVDKYSPEIIFHFAAQPLVRRSYREPLLTMSTNIMGTVNLLESIRKQNNTKVVVMITTDKVYANESNFYPYRETDPLGGYDPYSASKAASEIVIASYRDSFLKAQGIAIASARAGNVIGGGDWSEDRLIPDAIRAWTNNLTLEIRHPNATRPWQHVLEPLDGYLKLAKKLWEDPHLAGPYNFGPDLNNLISVGEIAENAKNVFGFGAIKYANSDGDYHEANYLALENFKASKLIGVSPKWNLQETINRTIDWYIAHYAGVNSRSLCEKDITAFENN